MRSDPRLYAQRLHALRLAYPKARKRHVRRYRQVWDLYMTAPVLPAHLPRMQIRPGTNEIAICVPSLSPAQPGTEFGPLAGEKVVYRVERLTVVQTYTYDWLMEGLAPTRLYGFRAWADRKGYQLAGNLQTSIETRWGLTTVTTPRRPAWARSAARRP